MQVGVPSVEDCPQPCRRGNESVRRGDRNWSKTWGGLEKQSMQARARDKRGAGLEFCQAGSHRWLRRRQRLAHVPPALTILRSPALLCVQL